MVLNGKEEEIIEKCIGELFMGFFTHNSFLGLYCSLDVTLTDDEFWSLVNFIRVHNILPEEIIMEVITNIEEEE